MKAVDDLRIVLSNYDFDFFKGNYCSVHSYLEDHFNKYVGEISGAVIGDNHFYGKDFIALLTSNIDFITEICNKITAISKTHYNGETKKAYDKAYALFELMSNYYLTRAPVSDKCSGFYRIREGDFRIQNSMDSKIQKAKLFHIKDKSRNLIGAFRYSISGFPCLYMSTGAELAWLECGMPKQFSYCQMVFDDGENHLKLIDFSKRADILVSVNSWLYNARKNFDKIEEDKAYTYLLNYIITYPLVVACSIKVKQRGDKFIEEYVIPQMLMQWVRESDIFDGVLYKSSLDNTLTQSLGSSGNVALPVKRFRSDGLCESLTSKIKVSDIEYFDVSEEFAKYNTYLAEIDSFKNGLRLDIFSFNSLDPIEMNVIRMYHQLIEVCEVVVKTYTSIIEGRYEDRELIFRYIGCLFDYVMTIYDGREMIISNCLSGVNSEDDSFAIKIKANIEKFYALLIRKVINKYMLFRFDFKSLENYENI